MSANVLTWGLNLDASGFHKSLNKATSAVQETVGKGFGDLIAPIAKVTAAVGSVAAIMKGITGSLELGAEMQDVSNRTGIAVENVMMLRKAFKDGGVAAESLPSAINKMQRSLAGMGKGGGAATGVLKGLGLDPQTLASAKPDEAFRKIGEAINNLPNATERSAAAMAIFGKSGGELLQVFASPAFQKAGNISNTAKLMGENAASFKEAHEALSHVGGKIQGFFTGIAAGFIPMMGGMIETFEKLDLSGIGKSIGDGIGFFIAMFQDGTFSTIISSSFMIGIKEAINFLVAGFLAVFQTLPAYFSTIGKNFAAFFELITTPAFWKGMMDSILSIAAAFRGTMLMAVANILDALRDVPGIGGKVGKAADFVRGLSESQFQQSAAYSESAANGGMGAAIDKMMQSGKTNMAALGSEFSNNFKNNGKILGGTEAEQKTLSDAIAQTIRARDASNAAGREEAKGKYQRDLTGGAFDPNELGMGAKASIVADSFAKIGGGGTSSFLGVIDVNRQQLSAQQQTNRLLEQYLKGSGGFSGAQLAR